jgi:hypothetical protein
MSIFIDRAIFLLVFISSSIRATPLYPAPIALSLISQHQGIDLSQVTIGKIEYAMPERKVLQKLGKPSKRIVTANCLGAIDRLYYPGLVIDLETKDRQKYVTRIAATSARYPTNRGVKVGDKIDKAIDIYTPSTKLTSTRTVTIPSAKYGDLFLVFTTNNRNQIVSISIEFEC